MKRRSFPTKKTRNWWYVLCSRQHNPTSFLSLKFSFFNQFWV